jgi:hypothetical protein
VTYLRRRNEWPHDRIPGPPSGGFTLPAPGGTLLAVRKITRESPERVRRLRNACLRVAVRFERKEH